MSLLELITGESKDTSVNPFDVQEPSPAPKKKRAVTKKSDKPNISSMTGDFNPYLIDMDDYMKANPIRMIEPRPEIYSFQAVSSIPEMGWIKSTSMIPFSPSSPDLEVQRRELDSFFDSLVHESSTVSKDLMPNYFIHTTPKPVIAFDTETTGLDTRMIYRDGHLQPQVLLVGLSLATSPSKGYYLPVRHNGLDGVLNWDSSLMSEFITRIFDTFITVMHNGQYDRDVVTLNGAVIGEDNRFIDTLLCAHIFDTTRKANNLKELSRVYINRPQIETSELFPDSLSKSFARLSLADAYVYAVLDTLNTYTLFEFFANHPTNNIFREQGVSLAIDHKTSDILRSMYRVGIPLNVDMAIKAGKELLMRHEMLLNTIYDFVGRQVMVSSPKQLSALLFEEFKIPTDGIPKGKDGTYSTSEDVLDSLYEKFPNYTILKYIVELRKLNNSLTKYAVKIINNSFTDEALCYLRGQTQFSLTVIPTGRLSSNSTSGASLVKTTTSSKTGNISYKYVQGAHSIGLNSQGLDSRGYYELDSTECVELPPEAQIDKFPKPDDYINELIKVCSEG